MPFWQRKISIIHFNSKKTKTKKNTIMKKFLTDNMWIITIALVIGVGYLVYNKYTADKAEIPAE